MGLVCALSGKDQGQINFDLIISNPPYLDGKHDRHLQTPELTYAPGLALEGGEDGLRYFESSLKKPFLF